MSRRHRNLGIGLALLAIVGAAIWQFAGRGPPTLRLGVVEDCSLHRQACTSDLPGGGRMTFEISPRGAVATDVLELQARFEGIEPATVDARFEGINMDMGPLELLTHELTPVPGTGDAVAFAGKGGVFACSVGIMHWLVLVRVDIGDTVLEIPYRFQTANAFG